MNVPRLRYWDHFYIFQGGVWQLMPPDDVVAAFNDMAERYEIILADIEEVLNGYQRETESTIHPGTASTA